MAINPTLSTNQWLTLKPEIRAKLIEIFKIPRTGIGHINYTASGPEVTSDGHTYSDLGVITVEAMQKYLHSTNEDFFELFNVITKLLESPEQFTDTPVTLVKETEEQIKERWTKIIKDLKIEAEEKGLLAEFKKILKHETLQKK